MNLRSVENEELRSKTVLLRADLDVPLKNDEIKDDTRLRAWYPTLELLVKKGAKIIVAGHLGRPKIQLPFLAFETKKENEELSLKPVANWIKTESGSQKIEEIEINGFKAWKITEEISLLENLRFYKEEEENEESFSKNLASLADVYVNDAFASSHRAHSSIVGVTKFLPSFAGIRLIKEVKELSSVLENPKRPLTILIGGAKIETKLPLVEKMHKFSDFVLVGGELSEQDKVLLRVMHEKLDRIKSILLVADLEENKKEITEYSSENFIQVINKSETVVWNGPMGLIEEEKYSLETLKIAKAISEGSAYSIVGGGDTVGFLKKEKLLEKFSFVSIGGGAMLEYLSGETLPGLKPLETN